MVFSLESITPGINTTLEKVKLITPRFFTIFNRFIISIAIFLVGFVVGVSVSKIIKKLLTNIELNTIVKKAFNVSLDLEQIISKFIEYFIYFITLILGLNILGISTLILNIIFIAIVIIIVASVILAFKDFIPNMIAGIRIKNKKKIEKGDTLIFEDLKGKVIDFDLNDVKLKNELNEIIFIPNKMLASNRFRVIKKPKE